MAEADAFDGGTAGEAAYLVGVAGLVVPDAGLGGLHHDDALALGGQHAREAAVATVLPTPVSVPVTK